MSSDFVTSVWNSTLFEELFNEMPFLMNSQLLFSEFTSLGTKKLCCYFFIESLFLYDKVKDLTYETTGDDDLYNEVDELFSKFWGNPIAENYSEENYFSLGHFLADRSNEVLELLKLLPIGKNEKKGDEKISSLLRKI